MRLRKHKDRDALREWDNYARDFERTADLNLNETSKQKQERIKRLLNDFEAFCFHYFPKVAKSPFAPWHKKLYRYVINNDRCYATAKVSRDMAKSSLMALILIYLAVKKEIKVVGYFSRTKDQAAALLAAVKAGLSNRMIRHDFGHLEGVRWTNDTFITSTGIKFKAIGAGQNPRGEKDEDSDRYDVEIFDDFDDDEVCRNPERLDNDWQYVTGACIPAVHTSGKRRYVFLNNKIAEDCIIQRAEDHGKTIKDKLTVKPLAITVNLVDNEGHSNWPGAYTDAECAEMIALAENEAETEYFNNPRKKGTVFQKEWMQYKKMPPLSKYKYLVAYFDGGFKKTKTSDTKALVLLGWYNNEYHLRKSYVENASIKSSIDWHYQLEEFLNQKNATAPFWMEEVFLLDLLYDHFKTIGEDRGHQIPIRGDKRKKPDKDLRIQNTAGYFERGQFYFDINLQYDRFCKELIDQYLSFRVGVKTKKDGPDAVEGAIYLLRQMAAASNNWSTVERAPSKFRY